MTGYIGLELYLSNSPLHFWCLTMPGLCRCTHNICWMNDNSSHGCIYGHPWWLSSKESAYNLGDTGLIPASGRFPGEGHANPLQYSCLENPMDIRTIGLQGVRHDWSSWAYRHTYVCINRWIRGMDSYLFSPDIVLSVPVNLQQSPSLHLVRLVHLFPGTFTWIWLDGIVWITWGQSWERHALCRLDTCITCANM